MKKFIFSIMMVALVALPLFASASNDVTFPQTVDIDLSGTDFTINTASTFDSFVINSNNVVFTVSASSIINLTNTSKKSYSYSGTNSQYMNISTSCDSSQSGIIISVDNDAPTTYDVTITTGGDCAPGGSSGNSNSSSSNSSSSSSNNSNQSQATPPPSVPAAQTTNEAVGINGGTVSVDSNDAVLTIPANALTETTTIHVNSQTGFPQLPAGYTAVNGAAYNFTAEIPGGSSVSQFGQNLSLTFNYSDSDIANLDENSLVVSYWDETTGRWVDVPTTIDATTNKAVATINHFTKFILRAKAATAPLGSLIKVSGKSSVYYLGHDGLRYVFPSDKVYFTWYPDFSQVLTITQTELNNYSLGGNVAARAGTNLLQFVNFDNKGRMVVDDPKVYAVEPGGTIRWITAAEIAAGLYGSKWEQRIIPVMNSLFTNYTQGDAITSAVYPNGSLVKDADNNLYYISDNGKKAVTASGKTSNGFQDKFALQSADLSGYSTQTSINDYLSSLAWTSNK